MANSQTNNATTRVATLLVIDSDSIIRETLQRLFSGSYVCDIADGSEVWESLESRRYDVVITDVSMPFVDGLQILRKIRARHLETRVIVISADGDHFKDLFLEMGAFAYFSKPFRFEELESAVAQALDSLD